jgi:hypothetical protein
MKMSTRATVHFTYADENKPTAIVYRHSDGYPEGLGKDLEKFFDAVEAQTSDTRFDDPSYLAAKFVVWQADQYTVKYDRSSPEPKETKGNMLDFLSVGIVMSDPGDIEYRYTVKCGHARPKVICRKARRS